MRRRALGALVLAAAVLAGCGSSDDPAASRSTTSSTTTTTRPTTTTTTVVTGQGVFAVGDSVMVDALPSLQRFLPGIVVDADVSRSAGKGLEILRQQQAAGTIAPVTVFGLGTNGPMSDAQLQELVQLTAGKQLVIVTTRCGHCRWTDPNNFLVAGTCRPANHCTVADWKGLADQHPEWFSGDGIHMEIGGPGADGYALSVLQAVATAKTGPPEGGAGDG